ncbi:hypothetical protein ABZP36_021518 [Zizania latifolia]
MGEEDGGKEAEKRPVSGFRKVVWIRQMIHRWQSTAAAAAARRSDASACDGGSPSNAAPTEQKKDDGDAGAVHAPDGNEDEHAAAQAPDDDDKTPLSDRENVVVVEEIGGGGGVDTAAGTEPLTPITPDALVDVPRGCCAVYVGAEPERRRRFVVPTAYLRMPVFRRLLEKAEDEFGFEYRDGALTIPCETEDFKCILVVMDRHRKGLVDDGALAGRP